MNKKTARDIFKLFQEIAQQSALGGLVGSQIGGLFGAAGGGGLVGSLVGIGSTASAASQAGASAGTIAMAAALPVAAAVKQGLSLVADGFKNLVQQAQSYARFASPAQVERLDRAFEDLYAAVGVHLLPIVDEMVPVIDAFNAAITEAQGDMVPVVQDLARAFGELFRAAAPALGPTISLIAELQHLLSDTTIPVLHALAEQTAENVRMFRLLAYGIQEFIRDIREGNAANLFNGDWARRAQERLDRPGGITVAARAASIISTEAIGEQARLAAFGARSVGERQLEAQQEQLAAQQEANQLLQQWLNAQGPAMGALPGGVAGNWQW